MKKKDKLQDSLRIGEVSAVGIEIVLCIVIGALGGKWLDDKFGTAPWLTLFGIAAGMGAVVKTLIRVSRKFNEKEEKDIEPPDNKKMGD